MGIEILALIIAIPIGLFVIRVVFEIVIEGLVGAAAIVSTIAFFGLGSLLAGVFILMAMTSICGFLGGRFG